MRSHRSSSSSQGGQRGAALVIAMLVFALCTALIVAMKNEFALFYQRGSNLFVAEQAYAYLRGAEDLAIMALTADFDLDQERERPRDDLQELWASPPTPYSLDEGGWLMGSLEDLQGRFNLNTLLPGQTDESGLPSYTPAQQQFIRLLLALPELELSEHEAIAVTRAVGDWLDSDSNISESGAEDDFYSGESPSYRAANRPMASVSELRAVANVTEDIYAAVSPWVTVWPQSNATLNIHTAPVTVLRTLNEDGNLQPMALEDAESLVQLREEAGFADLTEFLAHPAFVDKNFDTLKPHLGESSGYFLLSAEAEVADRRVRLYSVLSRSGRTVISMGRASGSL